MIVEHDGKKYEMICGSDVVNDGMYLELGSNIAAVLLLAFWSDADAKFTFNAYQPDLPFDLVEVFVHEARRRLPPTVQATNETIQEGK